MIRYTDGTQKSQKALVQEEDTWEPSLLSPMRSWTSLPMQACCVQFWFLRESLLNIIFNLSARLMVSTWLFGIEIFVLFWILINGIEFFLINFIFFYFLQVGWAVVSWKVFNPETTLLSYNTSFVHVYEVSTRYTAFTSWAYFTSYAWKVSIRVYICYCENSVSDRMSVGGSYNLYCLRFRSSVSVGSW